MSSKDPYKSIFGSNATDRSVMTPDELDLLDGLCEEADKYRGLIMERASVVLIARLARELGACRKRVKASYGEPEGEPEQCDPAKSAPSPATPEAEPTPIEWQAIWDALAFTAQHAGLVSDAHNRVVDKVEAKIASPPAAQGQKPVAWSYRRKGESPLADPALFSHRHKHLTDEGWEETPLFASPIPALGEGWVKCSERMPDYRGFALALFELTDWPHNAGDIDGYDLQECAERYGLLKIEKRTAPCGEDCGCAEYTDGEVNCYRKHPDLLSAAPVAPGETK